MSKKDQAMQIFLKMKGNDRKTIIQAFVDQLGMTTAGASTYYANCKRADGGGEFNVTAKKPVDPSSDNDDVKGLYTICTPRDEDGKKVVDMTHSHMNLAAAKNSAGNGEVVVRGLPDLDSDWNKLKPI